MSRGGGCGRKIPLQAIDQAAVFVGGGRSGVALFGGSQNSGLVAGEHFSCGKIPATEFRRCFKEAGTGVGVGGGRSTVISSANSLPSHPSC